LATRKSNSKGNRETLVELFPKQREFSEAVFSGVYRFLLFGGAIRGGKTIVTLALIIILCRIYPGSRWAVVRKDLPTLRRNTIPSFERIRPKPFVGDINRSEWTARCTNGSEIIFFPESLRDDPELNRWRGLEVNGFLLEEANELSESSFNKSIERAGTWTVPGPKQPFPLVLLTCNPAKNYVRRIFYEPWKKKTLKAPFFYLPSRVADNPALTAEYLASLENLKTTDPVAYERFVKGNWEIADDPNQLIKFEWVENARKNVERNPGKRGLGVDVARYGDDDSTIAHREGNALVKLEHHHGLSIDRTADIVMARINEGPVDANLVNIDVVGLGAGVVDNCRRDGFAVVEVQSGGRAIERDLEETEDQSFFKFKNLRSQLWWEFREGLRKGEICLDVDDPKLVEDLTAPRYFISGDKVITVESKDEIKKRIGRSTDAGDAAVYAFARLEHGDGIFFA